MADAVDVFQLDLEVALGKTVREIETWTKMLGNFVWPLDEQARAVETLAALHALRAFLNECSRKNEHALTAAQMVALSRKLSLERERELISPYLREVFAQCRTRALERAVPKLPSRT